MSKPGDVVFDCCECGEDVVIATHTKHQMLVQYMPPVYFELPDDFAIPKCEGCGETWWTEERSEAADRLYKQSLEDGPS